LVSGSELRCRTLDCRFNHASVAIAVRDKRVETS
jgi:hypothetical protein